MTLSVAFVKSATPFVNFDNPFRDAVMKSSVKNIIIKFDIFFSIRVSGGCLMRYAEVMVDAIIAGVMCNIETLTIPFKEKNMLIKANAVKSHWLSVGGSVGIGFAA